MMDSIQKKFIFLSQLIDIAVIDSVTGRKFARTFDFVASLKEMYPRVNGLLVRDNKLRVKFYVPWKNVKMVIEDKAIYIENSQDALKQDYQLGESEILLRGAFWDKQIVDINGSKVVRVNDLHLLKEGSSLWLVHVDIGFTGIVRRLGCLGFVQFFVKLMSSVELKDRLIPWKTVQPLTSNVGSDALALKVHHSRLAELHPADLADILIDLGTEEMVTILKSLDNATAAGTFQQLPMKIRIQIADFLDQKQLVDLIDEMAVDEAVDLLSQLPKKKLNNLMQRLPPEKVTQISELLGHGQDVAGSIMNTEFISARHNLTAGLVLEKIKKEVRKKETIYYIYIVDDSDILCGVVTLQQLLTVFPEKPVSEFMRKRVAKVKVNTSIKDVAEVFYKYDFTVVPVVDKLGKIQGIITIKDAFQAAFRPESRKVQ
ncbi:MAG: CBS domain-containing protein [Candidatus Omnitrophica bacterium]|nr:CBS domain-containing protein [Candidatus Omnitrophota bacterium]